MAKRGPSRSERVCRDQPPRRPVSLARQPLSAVYASGAAGLEPAIEGLWVRFSVWHVWGKRSGQVPVVRRIEPTEGTSCPLRARWDSPGWRGRNVGRRPNLGRRLPPARPPCPLDRRSRRTAPASVGSSSLRYCPRLSAPQAESGQSAATGYETPQESILACSALHVSSRLPELARNAESCLEFTHSRCS